MPRNLVLAASAGTGKTHALVGVVVNLVIRDRPLKLSDRDPATPLDPSRIVATTFSRKAAAEIRTRVTQELERLALAPETSAYAASLRGDGIPANLGVTTLSSEEIRLRAGRALTGLRSARIGTLHSFATGIVRAHAIELGLGPGFELASEADARARADDAIARALEASLVASPFVVRSLAEAAGGIGALVDQLRWILSRLEEDGRAAKDLALPTTDVEQLEASMTTLTEHARSLASTPRFEAAARDLVAAWHRGDEAAVELAAVAFCSLPATGKKSPELDAFAEFRRALVGTTNDEKGRRLARAFGIRHSFVAHASVVRDVLGAAETEIERASRAEASVGFGEVLRAARELLRDRPDVAEEIGASVDALLVDEFQDTSRVQRDLVQLLWARSDERKVGVIPSLAAVRDGGLLVVGDRKQSIYGFRGADVGVFAELAVGLAGAPAREALGIPDGITWEPREPLADFCALRHNRRSVPEVLAFANAFSPRRFCPGATSAELYEIVYVPSTEDLLTPPERESAAAGASEAHTTWLRIRSKGASSSRLEEALVISERIRAICMGTLRIGDELRPVLWRDVAVLATTNGMLDAVAFALAQADIPYVVAGKSFFLTREVRDLAAMLSFVLEPSDRLAMLEVLRGPWVGVHDETLLGLTLAGAGIVPPYAWSAPPQPDLVRVEDRARLNEMASLVTELARCASRIGPGAILREAVRASGFEEVLALLPRGAQRVANVRKLLAIADSHHDARAFRKWLVDASEQELAESEAATFSKDDDAVRLLTVHASKGLDFPVVFVPEIGAALPRSSKGAVRILLGAGNDANVVTVRAADATGIVLESPSFAHAYATARRRDRAERQRLAYVAITRAADAMFLVGGKARVSKSDVGSSTLAVLDDIALDAGALALASLAVEDVDVPAPTLRGGEPTFDELAIAHVPRPSFVPAWRHLSIAPTALADFSHCARRFELVHLLGLPEHVRGARAVGAIRIASTLDARTQGTLAHAVLERVDASAFGGHDAEAAASRALVAEGVPVEHSSHALIVARVARFLGSSYAQSIARVGAEVRREVAFVLSQGDAEGRQVVLRGSVDLVVAWPDGAVDVVDYKSARRGADEAYAFQLDVYARAMREMFPSSARLRAGLIYLGGEGATGDPMWRILPDERVVAARLASLGDRLVRARWEDTFPRVPLDRCASIHCGFIGRCHASTVLAGIREEPSENGTEENPSRATTT